MKTFKYISLFLLLQSCASAYHPVYPKNVKHSMHESKDNIDFSYQYGVLGENGNGKYVRRAKRQGHQIVSYKITNNTKDTLVVGKDLVFANEDNKTIISNALNYNKTVKQYPLGFLPYISGSYFVLYTGVKKDSQTGKISAEKVIPVGFFISLPIMLGNMIVANFSNKAFYDNLKWNDMNGKAIKPKESIYGLFTFQSMEQIALKLNKTTP